VESLPKAAKELQDGNDFLIIRNQRKQFSPESESIASMAEILKTVK
jgi:hypothetical protein